MLDRKEMYLYIGLSDLQTSQQSNTFFGAVVYRNVLGTREELITSIQNAYQVITPGRILAATRWILQRCRRGVAHNGGHF